MLSNALRVSVRLRYLILAGIGAGCALPVYQRFSGVASDFYVFAYAGRAMFGFMPGYHSGPLHLYVAVPEVQVGPPTLLLSGVLQRILLEQSMVIWSILIGLCGLATVRAGEVAARRMGAPAHESAIGALFGGVFLMAGWAAFYEYFHLEDAVAVALIAWAFATLVPPARNWWAPAVMLGTATACKPWALIAACLLVLVPKASRLKSLGLFVLAGSVWWLPFMIDAPGTVRAVASLPSSVFTTSTWAALGWPHPMAPPGFRILQFAMALSLGLLAIVRGRPAAAPLMMFAGRILLDPRSYTYYAAGPLAGALIWDLARRRRVPVFTIATAGCEVLLPLMAPTRVVGWTHLVYALGVIAAVVLTGREVPLNGAHEEPSEPAVEHGAALRSPMFQPALRGQGQRRPLTD